MAEFDNGIPESSTDVTKESISAVLISKELYLDEAEQKQLKAVLLEKAEFIENTEIRQINSVLMTKERTNKVLYCSFL